MAEEVASTALSAARQAMEITAELLKMLAPYIPKLFKGAIDITRLFEDKHLANKKGGIKKNALVALAAKANSAILSQDNILSSDVESIVAKAKAHKIPVSVIGDGDKQSVAFLDRDKAEMKQIMNEVMQERLVGAPQNAKSFTVSEYNILALKSEFEKNGIECQFAKGADGKVHCIYNASDAEKVELVKSDFKAMRSEITEKCSISINVPETERQKEISYQIDSLTNAEIGSEKRSEVYDSIISDMNDRNVEFPQYSENNMRIISNNMPYAKQVAGKAFWEQQGFALKDDAKGIEIVAPLIDDSGKTVLDQNGNPTFTKVVVYDISETNAYDKAIKSEITKLQMEYNEEKAAAFAQSADKEITISDATSEKSLSLVYDDKHPLTKSRVMKAMQKEFGYTKAQAELAANKLCDELKLDPSKYLMNTQQRDAINALKTNIRFESDSILLRDVSFSAVNMQGTDNTHIFITTKDGKAATLTPATMTEQEMKNICTTQLNMTEVQAAETVAKAIKIDTHIQSKLKERVTDRNGISHTAEIERTSDNSFTVKVGTKQKTYDLSDTNLAEKLGKDFGINSEKAKRIIDKAKMQSPLQNRMNKAFDSTKQKMQGVGAKMQSITKPSKGKKI